MKSKRKKCSKIWQIIISNNFVLILWSWNDFGLMLWSWNDLVLILRISNLYNKTSPSFLTAYNEMKYSHKSFSCHPLQSNPSNGLDIPNLKPYIFIQTKPTLKYETRYYVIFENCVILAKERGITRWLVTHIMITH